MFQYSRRQMIQALGGGIGLLGLAPLLEGATRSTGPHFLPRAKRVIHLCMNGGPFQADFFDPSPSSTSTPGNAPPMSISAPSAPPAA